MPFTTTTCDASVPRRAAGTTGSSPRQALSTCGGGGSDGDARRRVAGPLMVLALAVLSAGCGSGGGGASTATTSTDTRAAAFRAYAACMKQNGVTLPAEAGDGRAGRAHEGEGRPDTPETAEAPGAGHQGGSLPPGVDQATFDRARQACQNTLPADDGAGRQGDSADAAYRSCLRDNGVNVPTTVAGRQGPPPTVDRSDPALPAASAKCAPLLPDRQDTSTTTSSTP